MDENNDIINAELENAEEQKIVNVSQVSEEESVHADAEEIYDVPESPEASPEISEQAEVKTEQVKPEKKKSSPWKLILTILFAVACTCAIVYLYTELQSAREASDKLAEHVEKLAAEVDDQSETIQVFKDANLIAQDSETGAVRVKMSAEEIYELAKKQLFAVIIDNDDSVWDNAIDWTSETRLEASGISSSGMVFSKDGYLITNYHVFKALKPEEKIYASFYGDKRYEATIVAMAPDNDIAVLKIDADDLDAPDFANSDELVLGEEVFAVGHPLGNLKYTMTMGHISAVNRLIDTDVADELHMFQTDAAVNQGNSGCPVYNEFGQVVGMVTAKYEFNGSEGLGFAIPSNDLVAFTNDLIQYGHIRDIAAIGAKISNAYTPDYINQYGGVMGALITDVYPGGAAETAGLQTSDVIVAIDNHAITGYDEYKRALKSYSPGDKASIEYIRGDKTLFTDITFAEPLLDVGY